MVMPDLKLKPGEPVRWRDGAGGWHTGRVLESADTRFIVQGQVGWSTSWNIVQAPEAIYLVNVEAMERMEVRTE